MRWPLFSNHILWSEFKDIDLMCMLNVDNTKLHRIKWFDSILIYLKNNNNISSTVGNVAYSDDDKKAYWYKLSGTRHNSLFYDRASRSKIGIYVSGASTATAYHFFEYL